MNIRSSSSFVQMYVGAGKSELCCSPDTFQSPTKSELPKHLRNGVHSQRIHWNLDAVLPNIQRNSEKILLWLFSQMTILMMKNHRCQVRRKSPSVDVYTKNAQVLMQNSL